MKTYLVLVEAEDYVSVEADTPEEAAEKAISEVGSLPDWKATVLHSNEDLEVDDCDIPY